MTTKRKANVIPSFVRGNYGEIDRSSVPERLLKTVDRLIADIQKNYADEHGSWKTGIVSLGRKGSFEAINIDLYGISRDRHSRRVLAVVQVRQSSRQKAGYYMNIRKNYFLIGRNEDKSVFAHAVSSAVIHRAIRDCADVVSRCQRWIFGAEYERVIRQGDMALVPVRRIPKEVENVPAPLVIRDSHQLTGEIVRAGSTVYVCDGQMVHTPGIHPTISVPGWCRVVEGERAEIWKFALGTAD